MNYGVFLIMECRIYIISRTMMEYRSQKIILSKVFTHKTPQWFYLCSLWLSFSAGGSQVTKEEGFWIPRLFPSKLQIIYFFSSRIAKDQSPPSSTLGFRDFFPSHLARTSPHCRGEVRRFRAFFSSLGFPDRAAFSRALYCFDPRKLPTHPGTFNIETPYFFWLILELIMNPRP